MQIGSQYEIVPTHEQQTHHYTRAETSVPCGIAQALYPAKGARVHRSAIGRAALNELIDAVGSGDKRCTKCGDNPPRAGARRSNG
jgi:hypothetical protein